MTLKKHARGKKACTLGWREHSTAESSTSTITRSSPLSGYTSAAELPKERRDSITTGDQQASKMRWVGTVSDVEACEQLF